MRKSRPFICTTYGQLNSNITRKKCEFAFQKCEHCAGLYILYRRRQNAPPCTTEHPEDSCLRMPHERHAWPWFERPPGLVVPAAVGVPVHVGGVDAAIRVDVLHDCHMAVVARALYVRLQDDDGIHMGGAGNNPAGSGLCSIVPLIGVAYPVYVVAG